MPVLQHSAQVRSQPSRACRINNKLIIGVTLVFVSLNSSEADANGFAIRAQSAVGMGMAFAGEGTPGMGLSAMFWNPAAVSQVTGFSAEAHVTYIDYASKVTADPGTTPSLLNFSATVNVGKPAPVPALYAGYQLAPDWFIGVSVDAPFGLGTSADSWAGQQLALNVSALSLEAAPVVGWKIIDGFSVAAGPRILWFKGKFSRALLADPNLPALPVELAADDFGIGFAVGATIAPTPSTEVALGYRSKVDLELSGDSRFPSSPVMAQIGLGAFDGTTNDIAGSMTLPDQAILSFRQRLTDTWTLLGTVEWTGWSVLQSLPLTFTSGPTPGVIATTLNFNYRDSRYFSAGAEYAGIRNTTLRAGVGYDVSPISDAVRGPALPESNGTWVSAGLTYRLTSEAVLDLSYMYVAYSDAPINVVPGHPDFANLLGASLIAHADSRLHVLSVGLRYQF